jgi:hypothetical protein
VRYGKREVDPLSSLTPERFVAREVSQVYDRRGVALLIGFAALRSSGELRHTWGAILGCDGADHKFRLRSRVGGATIAAVLQFFNDFCSTTLPRSGYSPGEQFLGCGCAQQ